MKPPDDAPNRGRVVRRRSILTVCGDCRYGASRAAVPPTCPLGQVGGTFSIALRIQNVVDTMDGTLEMQPGGPIRGA